MAIPSKVNFQDRLNKIAQDKAGTTRPDPGPIRSADPNRMRRLVLGFGALALGIAALGIGGAYAFKNLRHTDLMALAKGSFQDAIVASIPAPDSADYDGLLNSGPRELRQIDRGWELPANYVVANGHTDLQLSQVALAGLMPAPTEPPAATAIPFDTSCDMRPLAEGEVLHNVSLDRPGRYTETMVFSRSELAEAAAKRIEGIAAGPKHYRNAATVEGRMGLVDVLVTDTTAPVYLVLQTGDADTIWNVHLTKGASLAHVVMIGNKSALSAPAGDYTVTALRARDFVNPERIYLDDIQSPCPVAPVRPVAADWAMLGKQDHPIDGKMYREFVGNVNRAFARYNDWYQSSIGAPADTNLVDAVAASAALVGPIPGSPVTMTDFDARPMQVAGGPLMVHDHPTAETLHTDLVSAAAGGDLSALRLRSFRMDERLADTTPGTWWSQSDRLADYFSTTAYSATRYADVAIEGAITNLALPTAPVSHPDYAVAYAAAAAPTHLAGLCQELLQTIASACEIRDPDARVDDDGIARVSGQIAFLAADYPGKPADLTLSRPTTLTLDLPGHRSAPYAIPSRLQALKAARLACNALRRELGSCGIIRLALGADQDPDGARVLQATVTVAIMADVGHTEIRQIADLAMAGDG